MSHIVLLGEDKASCDRLMAELEHTANDRPSAAGRGLS